jgi:phosphoribosylanthranilate isomerase
MADNRQVRVKICGITRLEDAGAAVDAGAHALGFVFYPRSARYIIPENAASIISILPPFVTTVGVFVNLPRKQVEDVVDQSGITVIQLHGDEPPSECVGYNRPVIKALRIQQQDPLPVMSAYKVAGFLLDTAIPGTWGGTGVPLDWQLFSGDLEEGLDAMRDRLILAGGLNAENVGSAIRLVKPFAVDVSSGVEDKPGIKNHKKIKEFMDAVRQS